MLELSIIRKISSFLHYPVIITGDFEAAKEMVSYQIGRFVHMYITVCFSVHRSGWLEVIK